jgi:hypothetical protein
VFQYPQQSAMDAAAAVDGTPVLLALDWRRSDALNEVKYDVFAVLSLGVAPIITVFYPAFGLRLRTVAATSPADAEHVVAHVLTDVSSGTSKEVVCRVSHLEDADKKEHLVAFQAECQRYCATSLEEYDVYRVDDVPHNMQRFLQPSTAGDVSPRERAVLALKYGHNVMDIPPTGAWRRLMLTPGARCFLSPHRNVSSIPPLNTRSLRDHRAARVEPAHHLRLLLHRHLGARGVLRVGRFPRLHGVRHHLCAGGVDQFQPAEAAGTCWSARRCSGAYVCGQLRD